MRIASRLCVAAALCVGASAQAEIVYGVTAADATRLVRFDTANVAAITNIAAISGLNAGHALRGVDFRPADGQLYAVSTAAANPTNAQLYTINLTTGAATAVGTAFTIVGNTSDRISLDFNPTVDRLRLVTGSGQNYRINPNNGVPATPGGDTAISGSGRISGIAYTNNVVGATQSTLYAYDYSNDDFGTIGGINGVPSPNLGAFSFIASNSISFFGDAVAGFDISGATGDAYFSADSPAGSGDEFYRVNLSNGVFTQIGPDDVFSGILDLLDFSIVTVPVSAPATLALTLAALGLLAGTRRRTAAAPGQGLAAA